MNFPLVWISWIHACLNSTSLSIIINKKPSCWIPSSRDIRQGDLLSSHMFILVTQNLTIILNHAMSINMIPGFDLNLHSNFNHLMYADDLILVTQGSEKIARNIYLCFSIYDKPFWQRVNHTKSVVYFLDRFNWKLKSSICAILNFQAGSFPMTYLGILISPK